MQYKLLAASTMYFIRPDLQFLHVFVYLSQANLFEQKHGIAKCRVNQVRCLWPSNLWNVVVSLKKN